jgi:VCBS repeat-containing protein
MTPDTANGTIKFTDVDLSDTHDVTILGVSASDVVTGLANHATQLGWLSLGPLTDSTNGVTGSRSWTFSAADHYFDYLAHGESVALTYTVQVDDHHGGLATQDVVVTVTGTNDTPDITSGPQTAAIAEIAGAHDSSAPDEAHGTITFADVDLSDTHGVTIAGVIASGTQTGLANPATQLGWLSLGALTDSTNGVTGSQGWTFSAADHQWRERDADLYGAGRRPPWRF